MGAIRSGQSIAARCASWRALYIHACPCQYMRELLGRQRRVPSSSSRSRIHASYAAMPFTYSGSKNHVQALGLLTSAMPVRSSSTACRSVDLVASSSSCTRIATDSQPFSSWNTGASTSRP